VSQHQELSLARALGSYRQFASRMFDEAMTRNLENIATFVSEFSNRRSVTILDLGCWDGANLTRYAARDARLTGVEMADEAARLARRRSMSVVQADLNGPLPFGDQSFDVVTSNQVIEHLCDTDVFVSESYRVLRPGGLVIVSTENLASWHNVFALLFGWQAFSLSNVSHTNLGLGNPLAIHRGSEQAERGMEHQRIFSYRGLQELLRCHGFGRVRIAGAGYYPLPARVGRIDPRHAAFITAAAIRS
jgi:2-polyprenyl-3-methyl-5-hydroxy-6-metoxy-1,4-benzoquinol methylase